MASDSVTHTENRVGSSFSDATNRLLIIFCLDVIVTLIEFLGAVSSASTILWENFGAGLVDGSLIALNIWGLNKETHQLEKQGSAIAYYSDIALASVFILATLAGIFRLLVNTNGVVNGSLVISIAIAAALINGASAWLCPTDFINGHSARLKMMAGAFVAVATVITGLTIHFFRWYWIDPIATIFVGTMVMIAVRRRLAEQKPKLTAIMFSKSRVA